MARIAYGDGPSAPRLRPADAAALADVGDGPHDVMLGWTVERHAWLDDPTFRATTVLAGYALDRAIAAGRVIALPVRLSAVPSLLIEGPPDLAVVAGVRRGDALAFAGSIGWADVLAQHAGSVVVEIDADAVDLGGPTIDGNIVATIARDHTAPPSSIVSRPADDIDLHIGARVAELVPDDATLQFGPGGVGEGIARALARPVRIWSGLCTDAIASLHERGLLLGPAVAAYTWGGRPIVELAAAGMLQLAPSTVTHDVSRLSATPRFVGCNTALQVGLDGSVNVERIGDRVVAAVGGHADFCAGASRSVDGLSIIAVRSTTKRGASTIVRRVDVVSTQRSDVDMVVTEHGVADLRGVGDHERARRLIAVAAPEHRGRLSSTA